MKQKKVSAKFHKFAAEICTLILQFVLYHAISCVALGIFYETEQPEYYRCLLLLILPLIYLKILRECIKTFWLCFLLHLPVLATVCFAGADFAQKTIVCLNTIFMTAFSLQICKAPKGSIQECPAIKLTVIPLICYFIALYQGEVVCAEYLYVEILVFVLCCLFHEGLENTVRFVYLNKDMENFPAGQILLVNRLEMLFFLTLMLICMLLVPMLHLERIATPVLVGILALVKKMLLKVHMEETDEKIEHISQMIQGGSPASGLGTAETWTIWIIVEEVLKIALVIIIVIAILAGSVYAMYRLYRGFYANVRDNTDEKEFMLETITWIPRKRKAGEGAELKKTANGKIRQLYCRYVKKEFRKKEPIPETLTPEEMLILLTESRRNQKKEELTAQARKRIREIYERARYGQTECTEEEVQEMKKLLE